MNILLPTVVVALLIRWLVHRNLDVLLLANWRRPWLVVLAVAVQFSAAVTPDWARWPSTGVSLALALAFLVTNQAARNAYLAVFVIGLGLNALVMSLNHGMPVSPEALVRAHFANADVTRGHFLRHVPLDGHTRLRALADIMAIPPLRAVISIGDIVMLTGLGGFLVTAFVPGRVERRIATSAAQHGGAA